MIAVLLFFLTTISVAQSPKYVVLEHREKPKEHVIYEGEYVVVVSKSQHKIRGRLQVLSENLVQVKNKVIPISKIEAIGRKNQGIKTVASLIVTNGMNLFIAGVNDNLRNGWGEISVIHKASLPMLGIGIPLLMVTRKRKAANWKFIPVFENQWERSLF